MAPRPSVRVLFDKSVLRNRQITELAHTNEFPCADVSGMSVEKVCDIIVEIIVTAEAGDDDG